MNSELNKKNVLIETQDELIEDKTRKVADFLERMIIFLKISRPSDDIILRQAKRIVLNKIKLGPKTTDQKPNFANKTAKVHYYLTEISARLPEQDSVLFLICTRLSENFELYLEGKTPIINLRDQKIQTFLKFLFTRFKNQLESDARTLSSTIMVQKNNKEDKIIKSIEEKIMKKNKSLLEGILEDLSRWTENITDYSNKNNNNSTTIKKKIKDV